MMQQILMYYNCVNHFVLKKKKKQKNNHHKQWGILRSLKGESSILEKDCWYFNSAAKQIPPPRAPSETPPIKFMGTDCQRNSKLLTTPPSLPSPSPCPVIGWNMLLFLTGWNNIMWLVLLSNFFHQNTSLWIISGTDFRKRQQRFGWFVL